MNREYTMLVVDDEPIARSYVESAVNWSSIGVTTCLSAADGHEAMEAIGTQPVDILILDIRMPVMSGTALLDSVASQHPELQVVALSGYSDFQAARKLLSSGMVVEYLLKPAPPEELLAAVQRCIVNIEAGRRTVAPPVPTGEIPVKGPGHRAAVVEEVKRYIREHYATPITLDSAAEQVYLNPSYLSKLFSDEEPLGFSGYLAAERIGRAKQLLQRPGVKIGDVAEAVGYHDQKHFLRTFKKVAGMTPSQYRDRYFQSNQR